MEKQKINQKDLPGIMRTLGIDIANSEVGVIYKNINPGYFHADMKLGKFECDVVVQEIIVYCYSRKCNSVFKFNKETKTWKFLLDQSYLEKTVPSVEIEELREAFSCVEEYKEDKEYSDEEILKYFEIITLKEMQNKLENIPIPHEKPMVGCLS